MRLSVQCLVILSLAASIVTPGLAQSSGAETYKSKCEACHGAKGLGDTPVGKALKAASFQDPAVIKTPDAELVAIVKKGKNGKMPAFEGKLTDAEIKAVIAYIRTLEK